MKLCIQSITYELVSLCYFVFKGIHITEEFKGIANAVKVVQDVSVVYDDPPSKREYATDILHRNLVVLCEFLEGLYCICTCCLSFFINYISEKIASQSG